MILPNMLCGALPFMLSACVINPYMLSDLGAPQGDRARHRCRKNDTLTIPWNAFVRKPVWIAFHVEHAEHVVG